jgi:curved DNA-binding protein CbpA
MPPRPRIPDDDLYARLGVPPDASPEAIDLAWRGLLRTHHPDVAGEETLEVAKRINVAHDWLSDPGLRRRYDLERPTRPATGLRPSTGGLRADAGVGIRRRTYRPPTTAERVASIVDRVGRLSRDELDRLGLAEPAPIAFLATLRRFVSADQQAMLDAAEIDALEALPRSARRQPGIRDAVVGRLAEAILGDSLDELLGEPGGERARERLTRGWDAAIGQPRYGPATRAVDDLLMRLHSLSPAETRVLAASGGRDRLGPAPWPRGTSPDEDEALRVSSELASSDAAAAVADGGSSGARRAASRMAHLMVLRHAFPAAEFDRHAAPWLGTFIPRSGVWTTRVRHRA